MPRMQKVRGRQGAQRPKSAIVTNRSLPPLSRPQSAAKARRVPSSPTFNNSRGQSRPASPNSSEHSPYYMSPGISAYAQAGNNQEHEDKDRHSVVSRGRRSTVEKGMEDSSAGKC